MKITKLQIDSISLQTENLSLSKGKSKWELTTHSTILLIREEVN